MRFAVFLLFIVGCWCDVKVLIDQSGSYNIIVDNQVWLRSGRTAIYADSKWYSTEDNSLILASIDAAQGEDPNLGNWNETILVYNVTNSQTLTKISARIRQWSIVSAFSFHLDTGDKVLSNILPLDVNQVRTVFPSFRIEQLGMNDQRGFFALSGNVVI